MRRDAVPQGCKQFPHGRKAIGIAQRAPALPEEALAAQLRPHRLEEGTAQLLGVVHHTRAPQQRGTPPGKMLRTMAIGVLNMIALVLQRLAGLVCNVPPGSSPSHTRRNMALTHASVGHPTAVWGLVIASLPVRDAMDPYVRMRRIERHGIDKTEALAPSART
jgi:hypothetical protein